MRTVSPERIRRADPLAELEPAVEPDELRARVDAIVAHTPPAAPEERPRPAARSLPAVRVASSRHGPRKRLLAAVAVATAVAAAGLALLPGGSSQEGPASAADVLRAAAAVAADQPEPPPFTGYRYTEWLDRDGHGEKLAEQRVETWVDSEWRGRRLAHQGRILQGSGPSWGRLMEPSDEDYRYSRDILIPPPRVADLPTEPEALREALIAHERSHWKKRYGPATAEELDSTVTHRVVLLLGQPDTPPELRAALFGVLALTPGVRPAPDAKDALGRSGQAVAIPVNKRLGVITVIFDRETSQMLFWSEGSAGMGILVAHTVVRTARVAKIGDRP